MRDILLVDDEPVVLDILARAAQSWKFECQSARSAEEAIERLESAPARLVVTDLRMPGLGGVWLVRELQRRWPGLPVIVVTTGQEEDDVFRCLQAGVHHYLLKPIRFDEFRHALESTLAASELRRRRDDDQARLELLLDQRTGKLRRTFLSAIDCLVRMIEARDAYIKGHSLRVRRYALSMARALGLEPRQRRRLSLAAKLHDIGKVGLPEAILNKPSRLTEQEFAVVRAHPLIGARILAPIIRSRTVLAAIRGHHERIDGKGYPDGVSGENVPYLARILAVADCYDALTSTRAYRGPVSDEQARLVLQEGAGTQFDARLVQVFLESVPAAEYVVA